MSKMVRVCLFVLCLAILFTLTTSTAGVGLYDFFTTLGCTGDSWVAISAIWGLICGVCLVAIAWIPCMDWFDVDYNNTGNNDDLTPGGGACIHA